MPIATTGFSHVRLTVTDIARSRAFYEAVFGFPIAFQTPVDADAATREQFSFLFGGVIYATADGLLGLRPVATPADRFDEDRVGLDHLSFTVADEATLHAAAALLDTLGAERAEVKDLGSALVLEFRDPDGIALELLAAKG